MEFGRSPLLLCDEWCHEALLTCRQHVEGYKLFEGLRSLKVGVDHMVIHDFMFIHVGIMNRDIQNDLYNALIELHTTWWGRIKKLQCSHHQIFMFHTTPYQSPLSLSSCVFTTSLYICVFCFQHQ